jgi:hypothetical protein
MNKKKQNREGYEESIKKNKEWMVKNQGDDKACERER